MTVWVAPRMTGRGEQVLSLPAAHGLDAVRVTRTVTTADAWILARFEGAIAVLNRGEWNTSHELPSGSTPAGSLSALNVAVVSVAHWGLETGWGASEYNFNAGGIHCTSETAECFLDGHDNEEFAAYSSFMAFAGVYFNLVSQRYESAWDAAQRGSANYLLRLWAGNYTCGPKTAREATQLVARVVRVVNRGFTNVHASLPVESQYAATESDVANRCPPGGGDRRVTGGGGGGGGGSRGWVLGAAAAALLFFSSSKG